MNRRQFLKTGTVASLSALLPKELHAKEYLPPSGLYMISFYGSPKDGFGRAPHKRLTANGELFNPEDYTCAHRTLPFGTKVRVLNPKNEREVFVRVNDRGPFTKGRELDVSYRVAQELAFVQEGTLWAYLDTVPLCTKE